MTHRDLGDAARERSRLLAACLYELRHVLGGIRPDLDGPLAEAVAIVDAVHEEAIGLLADEAPQVEHAVARLALWSKFYKTDLSERIQEHLDEAWEGREVIEVLLPKETDQLRDHDREVLNELSEPELDRIDAAILRHVTDRWSKVARVVYLAQRELEHPVGIEDLWSCLGWRVIALAEQGHLESQGDLRRARFSEVRLPQA